VTREQLEEAHGTDRRAVVGEHAGAVLSDQREQLTRRLGGLVGDGGDAVEEEVEPPSQSPSMRTALRLR
jgi:hypothetical protein